MCSGVWRGRSGSQCEDEHFPLNYVSDLFDNYRRILMHLNRKTHNTIIVAVRFTFIFIHTNVKQIHTKCTI